MKNLLLILSLMTLCTSASFSQSGWFWQNPLPQGNHLTKVSFADANNGIMVGWAGTILRTTDAGANWTMQSSGVMYEIWAVDMVDVNMGTAVGDGGTILRTTTGGATWVEDEDVMPEQITLAQNYPNPVLGTTIIPFSIMSPAHVSLTVYNILGKKVVVLLDSEQMAGSHSIPFNSSGLVSGMYFYVLRTGMTVETRNMLVINP